MTQEEIKKKIRDYENEKTQLEQYLKQAETELIIANERITQVKENLIKAYGTDDPDELKKIEEKLLQEIQELEKDL